MLMAFFCSFECYFITRESKVLAQDKIDLKCWEKLFPSLTNILNIKYQFCESKFMYTVTVVTLHDSFESFSVYIDFELCPGGKKIDRILFRQHFN